MGKEDHSESQGEGKKSISLINLARLATLARLIWINEMACSFSSACCPQFTLGFCWWSSPPSDCWDKFVSVDWARLASWQYGDKWHSSHKKMYVLVRTVMMGALLLYIFRCVHAPLLLPPLRVCLHLWPPPVLLKDALSCARVSLNLSQCSGAWPPSLLLLNLRRITISRQQLTVVGMKRFWGIHRENIWTPAVHLLLFISSSSQVLAACRQIRLRIRGRLAVEMVVRVTGYATSLSGPDCFCRSNETAKHHGNKVNNCNSRIISCG